MTRGFAPHSPPSSTTAATIAVGPKLEPITKSVAFGSPAVHGYAGVRAITTRIAVFIEISAACCIGITGIIRAGCREMCPPSKVVAVGTGGTADFCPAVESLHAKGDEDG